MSDLNGRYREIEKLVYNGEINNPFILSERIVWLLKKLISSKDERCLIPNVCSGELSLCSDKADIYTTSVEIINIINQANPIKDNNIIQTDFLSMDIIGKYSSVVLVPPLGVRINRDRSENLYIEKSLGLLAEDGKAVILVPNSFLVTMAYRDMREEILNNYSLEAVLTLPHISPATSARFSIIIVENRKQTDEVYMSLRERSFESIYEGYTNHSGGFFIDSKEIIDRFDAGFYDPEYKEIRTRIQQKDTIKLRDISDIIPGCIINSNDKKTNGDYLIITPRSLNHGDVCDGVSKELYCDNSFVSSSDRAERCVLRNGDVLISNLGRVDWAVYRGDENCAIANHNITIIRGKNAYEEWLKLFFNTKTGVESLEAQLQFLSRGSIQISRRELERIYIPDIKMMKIAERINKGPDLESKVSMLFSDLGWNVKKELRINSSIYDIALYDKDKLSGVIEVKQYKINQIENNRHVYEQLNSIKNNVGNVSVYLFVDDVIYEFFDGKLIQLPELPRPGKKEISSKIESIETSENTLEIEKESIDESSLSDRTLLELILSNVSEIKDTVEDISKKLELLSQQIMNYQSLVDRQLEYAITPDEEERIIHAFSEECTDRIIRGIDSKKTNEEYEIEQKKLIILFGENAWKKMEDSSKTFLVSSKVIFNNLIKLQDIVDYSGVCLLVTKALEVEMNKRFCKNFEAYLKTKYPGKANHSQFPTALLDKYGKPLKPKRFTLGAIAYVLCYNKSDELTEEQEQNNRNKLLEYVKDKLFSDKSDDEIMNILYTYAEEIEEVRESFRNPSAHTNELRRVDAEECFALVVDVEKILKKMLDSFDLEIVN